MSHEDTAKFKQTKDGSSLWSIIGLALLLLVLLLFFSFQSDKTKVSPFAYPQVVVDSQKLENARKTRYGDLEVTTAQDSVIKLHELLRRLGKLQFTPADERPDPKEIKDLYILLEFHSDEIVVDLGYDGFLLASEPVLAACDEALEATLAQLRDGSIQWSAVLATPDRLSDEYRENCGNFLPELEKHKLITERGEWQDAQSGPTIANVLNRYRIGSTLRARTPTWRQLTSYEASLFCQLVVGRTTFQRGFRRECLERLQRIDPDYDADLAEVLLDVEENQLDVALQKVKVLAARRKDKRRFWTIRSTLENLKAQAR
jgi:hypothetical protein